jgi:hypothetical protein
MYEETSKIIKIKDTKSFYELINSEKLTVVKFEIKIKRLIFMQIGVDLVRI